MQPNHIWIHPTEGSVLGVRRVRRICG